MPAREKPRPERHTKRIPVRPAVDGSELCLQCGLCCDGTIFTDVPLNDGEEDYVESLGLEVLATGDGGSKWLLPCPKLVDGCCSLYTIGRPAMCGSYRCVLLKDYLAGTRRLDEALPVVHLVRALAR